MPIDILPPRLPKKPARGLTPPRPAADNAETIVEEDMPSTTASPKARWWHRWYKRWQGFSRRKKISLAGLAIIALVLIVGGLGLVFHKSVVPFTSKAAPAKPITVASPLSGLQVAPALAKRPVTGIMIENSVEVRPQSGLQDAGVVYEAIAEGGITRFLALFQDTTPQYIGPVRSVRPYFIDFAAPFQASIVHVGGSPDALSQVRDGSYRDLDQFFNDAYFDRITSRDSPHNVYTSFTKLDALNQSKGYTTSTFTSWPRKADAKLATPTAKSIDFSISGPSYNVHYDYNTKTNSYDRSEGGAAHIVTTSATDKVGILLSPKVVIALVMPFSIASDGTHSVYGDSGSGPAYFFQDGSIVQGTWNKSDIGSQFVFNDSAGKTVQLNAGQTWISLVSNTGEVSYAP